MFRDGNTLRKSEEELSIEVRMMAIFQEGGFGEGVRGAPGQLFKFLPGGNSMGVPLMMTAELSSSLFVHFSVQCIVFYNNNIYKTTCEGF